MRCVYTPFVTMTHRGHASIGARSTRQKKSRARNEASIFLLKRWPAYTGRDPYFPDNVRDWLYADSPTPIRMWTHDQANAIAKKGDLLLCLARSVLERRADDVVATRAVVPNTVISWR